MTIFKVRIKEENDVRIIDVYFSQLCKLLPPRSKCPREFWNGDVSVDGPHGNVKIVNQENHNYRHRFNRF